MEPINIGKHFPQVYEAYHAASNEAEAAALRAGVDPLMIDLVKIRCSQLNGCAFCLRSHSRDAISHGETSDRLAVLAAWWESEYFSPEEEAALTIAENITSIDRTRPMHPDSARDVLTDAHIAAISWIAVVMNGWNRVAVSSHYHVGP